MEYEDLLYEREDGIAIITLNHPEKLNAMTAAMRVSLTKALEEARNDDDVMAVIVTGAGQGFCSGADVGAGRLTGDQPRPSPLAQMRGPGTTLWNFEKPTIAAVNGVAAGSGLSLALYCDIRIAAESARFSAVWVRRALTADAGATYFMPRILGVEKALKLMYTGDMVDAKQAERIGLVSQVVPDSELMKAARELAGKIAQGPPIAIQLMKRALYREILEELPAKMDIENYNNSICYQTEDYKEGVRSFLERRPPKFTGR